jgi:hypothetical protein
MSDFPALEKRFERAAESLTGRAIVVRMRPPASRGAMGEISKSPSGLVYMDLHPAQPIGAMYKTFLHECAHVIEHYSDLTPSDVAYQPAGSLPLPEGYRTSATSAKQELGADQLADQLEELLDYRATKYIQPGDPEYLQVQIKLTVLEYFGKGAR